MHFIVTPDFHCAGGAIMRAMWKTSLTASLAISVASFAAPAVAAECGALPLLTTLTMNVAETSVPVVDGMIADKPVRLMVDTGGAFSTLTKRAVRELGLPTSSSRIELRNVRGQKENLNVKLPSITLGRIRQEGVYFMVDPGPDDLSTNPPH